MGPAHCIHTLIQFETGPPGRDRISVRIPLCAVRRCCYEKGRKFQNGLRLGQSSEFLGLPSEAQRRILYPVGI